MHLQEKLCRNAVVPHGQTMRQPTPDRPPAQAPLPAAGGDLRDQRARRLDGDRRPLGPRLRPHRQRPGDRRRSSSAPASCRRCSPRSSSPAPSSRRRGTRCRSSTAARRRPSAASPCWPTTSPWRAVIALAAVDGALALDRPLADPGRGRRRCSSRPASCAPATPCSTSPSPAAPRSAPPSPASSSPASASSRRCCSTPSPSTSSPASCFSAGHMPQAEPEPGQMRDRVRAGIAYIREKTDSAPAADRPGRRLRLLRRGDPGRGHLREGDARAPATPATA